MLNADSGNNAGSLNEKFVLRSHMDSVRGAHFIAGSETLATVSEDCMVKLWAVDDELEHRYIKSDGNLEPYFTLRGHTGPLLSVTGPGQSRKS